MAQDEEFQHGKAAKPPVSAHPAFPVIVGLWFAALLGLGTIVMPAVVLEKFASATGVASAFPAAEAPLTASARAAFALLATIVGLVGGLMLARRVAAAQHVAHVPRRRAARPAQRAARRPLSVHEDLGEDAIGSADERRPPIPGRRRALAVTEEDRPSDFLLAAPLPGADALAAPELPTDEEPMTERPSDFDAPTPVEPDATELDLSRLVADSPIYDPPADQPPADAQVFAPAEPAASEPEVPAYVPDLDTRKPRALSAPPPAEPAPVEVTEQAELTLEPLDAPLEDLGMVQLAERLGRSLHQRLAAAAVVADEPHAEPLAFSPPSLEPADDSEDEAFAVPPPVVPDALRAFMDAAPEELASASDEAEVPPPVVPAALRPFAFDPIESDDDDELDASSFTLPLGTMAPRAFDAPTLVAAESSEDEAEDEDDALVGESYSSLLAMNNPFRPRDEFVRVDEPEAADDEVEPAVVFPGQEPVAATPAEPEEPVAPVNPARPFDAPHQPAPSTAPARPQAVTDPAETDRALRSALANLQRMSGAA